MVMLDAFPEPVYKGKVVPLDSELPYIKTARERGDYQNIYGNTTSNDSNVLNNLPELKSSVQSHLDRYLREVIGASGVELRVTQSWMNFNDYDTSHHTHIHVNSIVSGVVYLSPNPPPLILFRKQDGYPIRPMISKMTKYNSPSMKIDVQQWDIVLFPSQMPHGVDRNPTNQTRISLAFNTFYKGVLGSEKNLTHLEL